MYNKVPSLIAGLLLSLLFAAGCGNGVEPETESPTPTEDIKEVIEEVLNSREAPAAKLAALQETNTDVYAWLEITGTDISFPVLQSADDEYFYLMHGIDGAEDDDGCIYTEYYNSKDFTDPNTVIYGRNKDTRFGRLHQYQDRDFFDTQRELKIYLPDRTLTYQIFAAYTYDDRHLIATYDFADKLVFTNYLEDVFAIRAMDAFIDSNVQVTAEDRIVTLSTGVTGQDDKRYLVQAVLTDE